MGHLRALAGRLAFITLIGATACDDGGKAPGFVDEEDADVSGDEDAGDAGMDELDGGEEDASDDDGSTLDTGLMLDPDGGPPRIDAGDISECEGDILEFKAARAVGRPLTAAIAGNRVHLVYVVPAITTAATNNTGLRYVPFDTTGEAGMARDVVNVGVDAYYGTRDPSLVAGPDKIELFYTSNAEGPYELFYTELTGTAAPSRETTNTGRNEYALAAGLFGDGAAVAYSDEPIDSKLPGVLALKLPGMPASELVPAASGYRAAQVAFAQIGSSGARRGVAAFLSDLSSKPGVFALPVASNGAPAGALVTLTTSVGGASAVDVGRNRDGRGAVLWTETPAGSIHQLRFRSIAEDGTINSAARALTTGNQDLRDFSVAAYSHGYVVAYRRVAGVLGQAASIWLLFLDPDGNASGTRLVHTASVSGGGLKVLVANDGRLVVLWADTENALNPSTMQTETVLKVRAARLSCAN
jgi:hypothetical protein